MARALSRQALEARTLLALANSFYGALEAAWESLGNARYRLRVEGRTNDYLVAYRVTAPGLVLLDGSLYYEVDREHRQVPVPEGRHELVLTLTPYGDFGEPLIPSPPASYLAQRDESAYMLFLYSASLLDLAEAVNDAELASDIYMLLTNAFSGVRFYSVSPEQLIIASSLYHTNIDVNRAVNEVLRQSPTAKAAYAEGRLEGVAEAVKAIREGLAELRNKYGKRGEAVAVGHAHIDAAWLWPFEESRRKVLRTVATVIQLMRRFPEATFVQSSALYYEWLLQDSPELLSEVRRLVKEGRWELGAGYVEFDANLTPGEAVARQLLYSQRLYLMLFSRAAEVLWLPDSFGFSRGLAQLARLGGIKVFATHKLSWNDTNRFPMGVFEWVGADGRPLRAMAFGFGGRGYNATLWPSELLQQWRQRPGRQQVILYSYGYGDGGGGPNEDMLIQASIANELPLIPAVRHGTPSSYASLASPEGEWRDDLYVETHRGTYTSHLKVKRLHEEAVAWLREVEAWSALSGSGERFEGLWKVVLRDEFHDVLPGSAVAEVYRAVEGELADVASRAREAASRSASAIAGHGDVLLAFNSLPWPRRGYVELDSPVNTSQRLGDRYLAFFEAPPLGHAPVGLDPGDRVWARDEGDRVVMGNGLLEVAFSREGRLLSLRLRGQEYLSAPSHALTLYQNAPGWADAWDVEPGYESSARELRASGAEVIANGPLVAAARLTYLFHRSRVEVEPRIYAGLGYLELIVRTEVPDREQMLKAWFHLNVNADLYAYGGPASVFERTTSCATSWEAARFEYPFQKFVDLSDSGHGVAILSPHAHGASVCGSSVGLTLLRTPMFPDPLTDLGGVEVRYAIMPHEGSWREAGVVREAYSYWAQVTLAMGQASTRSLGSLEPASLILEAIKPAEDGNGIVFRIYDAHNAGGIGLLRLPFEVAEARSIDLLELNEVPRQLSVSGNEVRFSYGPREVVTLLVRPRR